MNTRQQTKRLAFLSLCVAIAMILGYIESLFPIFITIPGFKIGLANIVILWILYTYSLQDALLVNIIRVFLNTLLFGNIYSFLFSLGGAITSLIIMSICKKYDFHIYSVSMMGGVFHNIGQMIMALLFTSTQMIYYLPILLCAGMICGTLNGLFSKILLAYINPNIN